MDLIAENIRKLAASYLSIGYSITVNRCLPYIAISDRNNITVFFVQEHNAEVFLDEVDELVNEFNVTQSEAIFYLVDQSGVIE
jgi:hypothetical protein